MYFNANDVTSFMAQKDFIDTAVVPLVSIDLSSEKNETKWCRGRFCHVFNFFYRAAV